MEAMKDQFQQSLNYLSSPSFYQFHKHKKQIMDFIYLQMFQVFQQEDQNEGNRQFQSNHKVMR